MDHGDRGTGISHLRYEEEEDHQSIYIGVPVPRGDRRKRRRRRSSRDTSDPERDRRYAHQRPPPPQQQHPQHPQPPQHQDHQRYERRQDLEEGPGDPLGEHPHHAPDIHRTSESQLGSAHGPSRMTPPESRCLRQAWERETVYRNSKLKAHLSPAAERLRYILGEEDELPTPTLFTEMDTLQRDGDELEWKETASMV
ncbi:unnamed protein product [Arctogadus glacialis]